MKIETLKRNELKKYGGILLVFIAVIVTVVQLTSRAKYKTTQSIELARGTINYTVPDLNLVSMYIEDNGTYKGTDTVPQSGYNLNSDKSYCAVNGNRDYSITFNYSNGKILLDNLTTKGTKCYLYFDKKPYTCKGVSCEAIMANMNTWKTRSNFDSIVTDTTTGVIYKSLNSTQYDDYGETYYFAGNPSDNWVKFGGFYWRIIRINGDGTIRMIYQGTSANTTGTGTQIGTSAFNSSYNNNMYVGYQYTNNQVHGKGTNSTIKEVLDNWYNNALSNYASSIATGGGANFCNDRTPSTSEHNINGSGGTGNTLTFYAPYVRLIFNKTPTLKCVDTGDRFTTPVGLITADEVVYAGGVYATNNSGYYLYTGGYYWTMSPFYFNPNVAAPTGEFLVYSSGLFGAGAVDDRVRGVRPVINLKADTIFSGGSGTSSNPYIVS